MRTLSVNIEDLDLATWPIFHKMTQRGLLASLEKLEDLKTEVLARAEEQLEVTKAISQDQDFNPGSSQQLAAWMAQQGLTGKTTKSHDRLATDERSLSAHEGNPMIDAVLEYRGLVKLEGTFISPTMELAKQDPVEGLYAGIVHPKWKLTRVRSGRVSTENPNLLAFPSRDEMGRRVRSCFIARSGYKFLSVDYSQLEPRVVTGLSQDSELLKVYLHGLDLYNRISSSLGVSRQVAKIVTLGVLYGMGDKRLQEQLALAGTILSIEECGALIGRWFRTHRGVQKLVEKIYAVSRQQNGWVFTDGGRGRFLPGLVLTGYGWPVNMLREEAERQAFNHVIQGTGMEQLKRAMIKVDKLSHGYLLLAIHDELLMEVPQAMDDPTEICNAMETRFYDVPLQVSWNMASDWGALK